MALQALYFSNLNKTDIFFLFLFLHLHFWKFSSTDCFDFVNVASSTVKVNKFERYKTIKHRVSKSVVLIRKFHKYLKDVNSKNEIIAHFKEHWPLI